MRGFILFVRNCNILYLVEVLSNQHQRSNPLRKPIGPSHCCFTRVGATFIPALQGQTIWISIMDSSQTDSESSADGLLVIIQAMNDAGFSDVGEFLSNFFSNSDVRIRKLA